MNCVICIYLFIYVYYMSKIKEEFIFLTAINTKHSPPQLNAKKLSYPLKNILNSK